MAVLRRDPLSHGWVILTDDAQFVRESLRVEVPQLPADECPFCPGHEDRTPPEVAAYRPQGSAPNGPGWTVRSVPNQSALMHIEGKFDRKGEGLYDMMNAIGAHEVIVESPEHGARFCDHSPGKLAEIVGMWRDRFVDLTKDTRFRYIQVFRNYKAGAGAQLPHPNSQLIALPVVPRWVREEIDQAIEYWTLKERCIFCDMVAQDRGGPRAIYENEYFVVIAPFASKFPYEVWFYPRDHSHQFSALTDDAREALADALHVVLPALANTLSDPPYNLIVHSAPVQPEKRYHGARHKLDDFYHWHIELLPRVSMATGFEYGTGFYVNPVMPEDAARQLREQMGK